MLGRHLKLFEQLTPEAVGLVWQRNLQRHQAALAPWAASSPPHDGVDLFARLDAAGLFHAEAVVAVVRDFGPVAEQALETMVGRPITRRRPGEDQAPRPRGRQANRSQRSDPRTIHIMAAACPKKPGTGAWSLWQLYREGMTVDEFMAAGGTRAAVRYDSEHGYIQLSSD